MGSWRLISLSEALKRAKEAMAAGCRSIEKVDLHSSLGRIAAVDIICPEDNPGFDRATVDGYAVCSKDTQKAARENPVEFWVAGEIRMGLSADSEASFGEAWRIPTGGMLPVGAQTVSSTLQR